MQNTTHVTQETDQNQNYGLFKSLLHKNTQQSIDEAVSKYNEQQQLHHSDPSTYPPPKKLLRLDASHYGIILSGREAAKELNLYALRSLFFEAFSARKNKESWEKCRAVPLTRIVLEHSSVRLEVLDTEEKDSDKFTYDPNFSFPEATLLELECHNKEACSQLTVHSY